MSKVGRIQEMTDEEIKNIDPKEVAYITLNSGEIIFKKLNNQQNKENQKEKYTNVKAETGPEVLEVVEVDALPLEQQENDELVNKVTQRIVNEVHQKLKNRISTENNLPKNTISQNHQCQFCAREGQLTANLNLGTNFKNIEPLFFGLDQTPQYFQYQPEPVSQLFQPVDTNYLKSFMQVQQNQNQKRAYSQNKTRIRKLIKNKKVKNLDSERYSNFTQPQPQRIKRNDIFRTVYTEPIEPVVFNTIKTHQNYRNPLEQSQPVCEGFSQTDFEWRNQKLRKSRERTQYKSVEPNLRNSRVLRLPNHNYLEVDCSRHKVTYNNYGRGYNNTDY